MGVNLLLSPNIGPTLNTSWITINIITSIHHHYSYYHHKSRYVSYPYFISILLLSEKAQVIMLLLSFTISVHARQKQLCC